ncbi:MAG: NAD(P)-binding domain-containing protein, partial [Planctomycetota bacterium]
MPTAEVDPATNSASDDHHVLAKDASDLAIALAAKIEQRTAVVGISGLGYVGLPLLAAFHRAGFPVVGFDKNPDQVERLKRGENYLKHLGPSLVSDMQQTGGDRFTVTADFDRLGECDVVLSCVPTPLGQHQEPDLSYVDQSAADAAKVAKAGQLVILESSTYPRTTREIVLPKFEQRGFTLDDDVFLAYSPEREDPGSKTHSTATIPKLVGGLGPVSGQLAAMLDRQAIKAQIVLVDNAEI